MAQVYMSDDDEAIFPSPSSLAVFRSWYFCIHIGCVLLVAALPVRPRQLQAKQHRNSLPQALTQDGRPVTDSNSNQKAT